MAGEMWDLRIVFASANIADPRYLRLFRVLPVAVGHFATGAGFGGVEWHPVMDWAASPRAIAQAVASHDLAVHSLHAAFRTTARSRDVNVPGGEVPQGVAAKAAASPLGRILMPEVVASTQFMTAVQERIGPRPRVLYPQRDPALDREATSAPGGPRLVQVTDHVAALLGARTPEEIIEKLSARGYDGIILDTHHLHPLRYGKGLPPVASKLSRSLPIFAPYIYGAHIALDRQDTAVGNPDLQAYTHRALEEALKGRFTGVTGEIMTAAWEAPRFAYAALETTAQQVASTTGYTSRIDLQEAYREIGNHLKAYGSA